MAEPGGGHALGHARSRALLWLAWWAILGVSLYFYRREHALEHFAWHLVYGSSFGLLLGAAWIHWTQRPPRSGPIWALAGYLYMIVPDLIWLAPTLGGGQPHAHAPWMDVFLGHVFLDTWAWTNHLLLPTALAAGAVFIIAKRHGQAAAA